MHKIVPVKLVNVVSCPTMRVNMVLCPKSATITRLYHHDYMRVSPRVFQVINELYCIMIYFVIRRYVALISNKLLKMYIHKVPISDYLGLPHNALNVHNDIMYVM